MVPQLSGKITYPLWTDDGRDKVSRGSVAIEQDDVQSVGGMGKRESVRGSAAIDQDRVRSVSGQ